MSAAGDASLAASLVAVDPAGLGGACLRSPVQPARTQWLEMVRELLPHQAPMRRVPFNIDDGRLLGGLDLAATLKANRPVAERGVLAAANGGIVVIAMAERLSPHTAACLNAVLDGGEILMQREGVRIQDTAAVGVIALDEGMSEDERLPASVLDRLAFLIDLEGYDLRTPLGALHDADDILAARRRLPGVSCPEPLVIALCATAIALGAGSARVSLLAIRAAKAAAALEGRDEVTAEDASTAGRLVLAPRASQMPRALAESPQAEGGDSPPAGETNIEPPPAPDSAPAVQADVAPDAPAQISEEDFQDIVLAATQAAIPRGLLATLRGAAAQRAPNAGAGRSGATRTGGVRGRPTGTRGGSLRGQARLNVLETLRAAAPWQRIRGRTTAGDRRIQIETADFRITRHQQRSQTLTIFAVDASGSSALHRLAEAKGAVELLLADCYVRRDQVAVVTFRGRTAELLLPPTRSLVRAKRALAGLPGGGGTPLAAAIDSAMKVGAQSRRRGETPILVLLSDGRANVSRNGAGGREAAHADALRAARLLRHTGIGTLFVDTSPRPNPLAADLAAAMDAHYIPLPYASAETLSRIVTAATRGAPPRSTRA